MVAPSWLQCVHPSAQKNSVYITDLRNLFWATGWLGGQYSISIKNIKTDWKLFEILEKNLKFSDLIADFILGTPKPICPRLANYHQNWPENLKPISVEPKIS